VTMPPELNSVWRGAVAEYVTAIAWMPRQLALFVATGAGELQHIAPQTGTIQTLQTPQESSIDCLALSPDGQFLAAGGQDGTVQVWRLTGAIAELVTTLEHPATWVDQLAWSSTGNQLAFNLGRYVQVWDVATDAIVTTLNFEASTVLGMAWHPTKPLLALCGSQGAKVWDGTDWDEEPVPLAIPSASVAIAWSPDGRYIADGNLDNTLTVIEWAMPQSPWMMRGFPAKVRQVAWSDPLTAAGAPLLAACSANAIAVWERDQDESVGWANQILEDHEGIVRAIAFQPGTMLLASAAEDGWVCLWDKAQKLMQVLDGAPSGFSCLSWHPQGRYLAAGGQAGEVLVWGQPAPGKGFG